MNLPISFVVQKGSIYFTYVFEGMYNSLPREVKVDPLYVEQSSLEQLSDVVTQFSCESGAPVWWFRAAKCGLTSHTKNCKCGVLSLDEVTSLVSAKDLAKVELCQVHLLGTIRAHLGAVTSWLMDEAQEDERFCGACLLDPINHSGFLGAEYDLAMEQFVRLQYKLGDIV